MTEVRNASATTRSQVAWRRSEQELVLDQVRGLQIWRHTRGLLLRQAPSAAPQEEHLTREQRLDRDRQRTALHREHAALLATLDRQLRNSGGPSRSTSRPRVVVAHRAEWLRLRLTGALRERGVDVIAGVADGADAVGTAVAEQPDVLLVEDRLPSVSGLEVVRAARLVAPHTALAVHVLHPADAPRFTDAGAHAVFTRQVTPACLAEEISRCLCPTTSGPHGSATLDPLRCPSA